MHRGIYIALIGSIVKSVSMTLKTYKVVLRSLIWIPLTLLRVRGDAFQIFMQGTKNSFLIEYLTTSSEIRFLSEIMAAPNHRL